MNKAIFFDRDGVINDETGHYYITHPKDFILNRGVIELLKWLKSEGFLLIIITNQGGISRGFYTKQDTMLIHSRMVELLNKNGIVIDEIYYCPHHPENERCICRKPDTVQIEKAITRFSINPEESFFVGDRDTDIEAGKKAGLKTIQVKTNQDMSLVIELFKKESGIS
jgi:D-glycero-D-manno-heptose 1,7-bisphosphate phosphatase